MVVKNRLRGEQIEETVKFQLLIYDYSGFYRDVNDSDNIYKSAGSYNIIWKIANTGCKMKNSIIAESKIVNSKWQEEMNEYTVHWSWHLA